MSSALVRGIVTRVSASDPEGFRTPSLSTVDQRSSTVIQSVIKSSRLYSRRSAAKSQPPGLSATILCVLPGRTDLAVSISGSSRATPGLLGKQNLSPMSHAASADRMASFVRFRGRPPQSVCAQFAVVLMLLPNTRLKLSAPVANQSGRRPQVRCSSIPFVTTPASRRSLSAIR